MSNLKTRVPKIGCVLKRNTAGRLKETESSIRNSSKDDDSKNTQPHGRCSSSPPLEDIGPRVKLNKKSQPLVRSVSKRVIASKSQDLERWPGNRPVPVISSSGNPLMPCHPARARELIRKTKAIRRFKKGFFYIQLVDRKEGLTQPISVGIDPGSKREGYTVLSEKKTYLNILADAVTWVKDAITVRRQMRRGRRNRTTPCRQHRYNRMGKVSWLAPSTKARWGWKLRVCKILTMLYPISRITVEDISAKTKIGAGKWNKTFSPLQVGKRWFYTEICKLASLTLKSGFETKELRDKLGVLKLTDKMSENFYAHNVDSYILARSEFETLVLPDDTRVMRVIPIRLHRRQLHRMQSVKGGERHSYGGTRSMGFKRGSFVSHGKYGVCYVGGTSKNKITLHDRKTGSRLTQSANIKECQFMAYNAWRSWLVPNSFIIKKE